MSELKLIEACRFAMGSDDADARPDDGEGPVREVALDAYYIAATSVTNAEFAAFVETTGYVSEAERFGWSYVFKGLLAKGKQKKLERTSKLERVPWWYGVKGAYWKKPEGPGSTVSKRLNHPVVHVSWNDAAEYCRWAEMRLPTEAEWECAARGGLAGKRLPWGDDLKPGGEHRCNVWQGKFPDRNTLADGYMGTAPVDTYEPNGFGLYNMTGNVWEWCSDWYSQTWRQTEDSGDNPKGPARGESKILKGGSYLCHDSYCNRYRLAARYANTPDSTSGHAGFRCVRTV